MKKLILICFVLVCLPILIFSQHRRGIIVGMADSWVKRQTAMYSNPDNPYEVTWKSDKWHPAFSFDLGYKFQYERKKYMFDISLAYQNQGVRVTFIDETEKQNARLQALTGTVSVNRFVWNRLFIGVGACQSYYWNNHVFKNRQKTYWDISALGQVGFDFRLIQVSVFYKHGFNPVLEYLKATQRIYMRDLGISVFVPL